MTFVRIVLIHDGAIRFTMFFKLNLECCGNFGRRTLYGGELTDKPPQVYRLHYEFTRKPNDDLLEVNSTFIGAATLAENLRALVPRPSGVTFDEVNVTTTQECRQLDPGFQPGEYKWFKITGKAGIDDFGLSPDFFLVVSDRIFGVMDGRVENCKASLYHRDEQSASSTIPPA